MVDSVALATSDNIRAFQRKVTAGDFVRVASRRMTYAQMMQASLTRRGVIIARTRGLKSTAIFKRRIRDKATRKGVRSIQRNTTGHKTMNLRYISVWLSPETGLDVDYRYAFKLRTRYISNYLSRAIRKYKVSTDGTFKMISVEPQCDRPRECDIVPDAALLVEVPFDQSRYEQSLQDPTDCEYYLELIQAGLRKASHFKEIPLDLLLRLINEFRDAGCRNEWQHKKKRFREQDIEVALDCYFTSIDFRLVATIRRISTKEELCSGTVIRTEPDEVLFEKMFKDILVDDKNITITDASDSPIVRIRLPDAMKGRFKSVLIGSKDIKRILSYSG